MFEKTSADPARVLGFAALLPVLVGVTNVALNFAARNVARKGTTLGAKIQTAEFAVAFAIGCLSLLLLITLYSQPNMNVARAIVLAGSCSIVIGATLGWSMGGKLSTTEAFLLILITAFYVVRWVRTA